MTYLFSVCTSIAHNFTCQHPSKLKGKYYRWILCCHICVCDIPVMVNGNYKCMYNILIHLVITLKIYSVSSPIILIGCFLCIYAYFVCGSCESLWNFISSALRIHQSLTEWQLQINRSSPARNWILNWVSQHWT